jgi:hypothetical protein
MVQQPVEQLLATFHVVLILHLLSRSFSTRFKVRLVLDGEIIKVDSKCLEQILLVVLAQRIELEQ